MADAAPAGRTVVIGLVAAKAGAISPL